ncbi:receptor-type tyrosine-protein phosphatase epsilon-like [Biomphalaria glabrata]|uniref:protein-tyrosine-phosphatase n=1 Tax=Biomphalaria glabrata TaxID=6526 RepID=A0A9W3ABV6_BIOGL|nr:receptor-type tyrosine-protein phosphatase epsilon-like [Biomphalaria glabrata]
MIRSTLNFTFFLIVFWYKFQPANGVCDKKWFGNNCQYKCHCQNTDCDTNGDCVAPSTCERGWFGYKCQYRDLTSYINTTENRWLIDGNDSTCSVDTNLTSISVTFNSSIPYTWMRLVFNITEPILKIKVFFKTFGVIFECQDLILEQINKETTDVFCTLNVTIQEMTITGDSVKSLCSLYVSGGRNVALKQPTRQTSTYKPNDKLSDSEHAVDGDTDNRFEDGKSCTHTDTDDLSPSWAVTFNTLFVVNQFILYNRGVSKTRLQNFTLVAIDDHHEILHYQEKDLNELLRYTVTEQISLPINEVNISVANKQDNYLTLCEVQIYGDCPEGKKGLDCNETCDVGCKRSCNIKGSCDYICFGFSDPPECKTACDPHKWGINCNNKCSTNCWNTTCNGQTGLCKAGCYGFNDPPVCKTGCPTDTWGFNCSNKCSLRCRNSTCNSLTGYCLLGCQDGYKGLYCDEECDSGRWGVNCSNQCTTGCSQHKCNITSGLCTENCLGYKDFPKCSVDCSNETWGINCNETCNSKCINASCNSLNGDCLLGCLPGFKGPKCSEELKSTSSDSNDGDSNIAVIVGPIIAALILLVLIIVAVLLWRRRTHSTKSKEPTERQKSLSKRETSGVVSLYTQIEESPMKETETSTDGGYMNAVHTEDGTSIALKDFNMFMTTHNETFFKQQFQSIPSPGNVSTDYANNISNKLKNRYKNICTYDHSRVNLKIDTDKGEGDYINASYIRGYKDQVEFIASQGPNKTILNDFVRMLWEQNVEKVVMLTNLTEEGKMKCEQYWPNEGKLLYGDIKIKLISTETFSDYTVRHLEMNKKNEGTHLLKQYHFHAWPDKGVPEAPWSLLNFVHRISSHTSSHYVVVHCSAGVGRTGTYIAIHNVLRQARETEKLEFFKTVTKLREDRILMVQTALQYEFLHKAVQAALLTVDRTVRIDDLRNKMERNVLKLAGIDAEFKALCSVCSIVNSQGTNEYNRETQEEVYQNTQLLSQQEKNRFPSILPKRQYRPHLESDNNVYEDYINAVFVPGLKQKDQHFLTQLPMPGTVDDFWRLVIQYNVTLIVDFEFEKQKDDSTIANYIPTEPSKVFQTELFEITSHSYKQTLVWDEQKLTVCHVDQTKQVKHEVLHIRAGITDLNTKKWVQLIKHLQGFNVTGGKVAFLCRNGASFSGLACALCLMIEKLDTESCVNIPVIVGSLKFIRPEVIASVADYRLLYEVLERYSETSSQYTNVGDKFLKEML